MTQENKELLLKDLCARLPYLPIVEISIYRDNNRRSNIELDPHVTENIWELIDKYHAIPYLRPMSSMTEEEITEYWRIEGLELDYADKRYPVKGDRHITWQTQDYLVSHHLDYRGLIPMGLALTAPEDMYNLNK